MPAELTITLVSIGVFALSTIYASTLAFYSPGRLYTYLLLFSVTCIGFALAQALQVAAPFNEARIIGVQFTYALILLKSALI